MKQREYKVKSYFLFVINMMETTISEYYLILPKVILFKQYVNQLNNLKKYIYNFTMKSIIYNIHIRT